MKIIFKYYFFFLLVISINACQKEINNTSNGGGIVTTAQKPKLGTRWTYRYYTYYGYGSGGLATSAIIELKAKSEDVLNGEKWLNIVDMATDTTVFLLNEKTGGLYQYTNSKSYLFCKDPAVVNDTYNTFNNGGPENFVVKNVKDTLITGIGNIPTNYYEGSKDGYIVDQVWYNENAWIVKKQVYHLYTPLGAINYYRYSTLFLDKIVY